MSDLRKKVYEKLKQVPKGKVITYKNLAKAVDSRAYRAIGSFMKSNHDPKSIPCYKVVKSDGEIGDYSAKGGIKRKISLLKADKINVLNNKISLEKFGFKFHA